MAWYKIVIQRSFVVKAGVYTQKIHVHETNVERSITDKKVASKTEKSDKTSQ